MSIDRDLLERADRSGTPTLRLYRFHPRCLSFGRNEPVTEQFDRAEIERLGIDVVRRPTGGRAVWHEHEVTYAVAAPIEMFGSLREAYCGIHERIAVALRSLGVDATLAPRSPRPDGRPRPHGRGSCFASATGGEVLVRGRKLVGSAQVRSGSAFLQHGSILIDAVSNPFADFADATSLTTELGRPVTFDEVANAIIAQWEALGHPTAPYRPVPPVTAPFSDPDWTWRR
jgi:lipoyl(octanoyl) transferase